MQVEVIYDRGKLELAAPLRLKYNNIRLMINVPDDEVEPINNPYNLPHEIIERAYAMRKMLDKIRNAPLTPHDELPELTEKQLERIAAFQLRG